jgi:hypothetical protein
MRLLRNKCQTRRISNIPVFSRKNNRNDFYGFLVERCTGGLIKSFSEGERGSLFCEKKEFTANSQCCSIIKQSKVKLIIRYLIGCRAASPNAAFFSKFHKSKKSSRYLI